MDLDWRQIFGRIQVSTPKVVHLPANNIDDRVAPEPQALDCLRRSSARPVSSEHRHVDPFPCTCRRYLEWVDVLIVCQAWLLVHAIAATGLVRLNCFCPITTHSSSAMILAGGQTDPTDLMYYKTEDALGRFGVGTCLCKTTLSRLAW
ncbi:uncharacterized protein N7483_002587 [Penicillium malachiteum]|uniref:uncharacterized protein n=1 Tax=Penicillium malachiteum TaxID=1324776 RepID=UPI0025498CC0|nr:uncharacterized protein N7483_002587 [Penicillium malachiteum]KAJ5737462.1 hypothetical protein N7483_002587 [Penicillium malachiteum]